MSADARRPTGTLGATVRRSFAPHVSAVTDGMPR